MRRLGLALCAVLAGCAVVTPPDVARAPTTVSRAQIDRLIANAHAAWVQWGSRVARVDLAPEACLVQADGSCVDVQDGCGDEQTAALCPIVHTYWEAVPPHRTRHACGLTDVCRTHWPPGDTRSPENTRPWSAVFVSKLLIDAGFSATEFRPSMSHAGYIVPARRLHTTAFDVVPTPAPVAAGDIICATRNGYALTPDQLDQIQDGDLAPPLHCDIVVAVDATAKTLQAIGGNVSQTVAMTEVALDAQGRLRFDPAQARPWILVMKARR